MLVGNQDKWERDGHGILGERAQAVEVRHCPDGQLHLAVLLAAVGRLGLDADGDGVVAERRIVAWIDGPLEWSRRSGQPGNDLVFGEERRSEGNGVINHLALSELAVLVPGDQLLDNARSRDIVVFETRAVMDRLFQHPAVHPFVPGGLVNVFGFAKRSRVPNPSQGFEFVHQLFPSHAVRFRLHEKIQIIEIAAGIIFNLILVEM
jgi:hypothetical protein